MTAIPPFNLAHIEQISRIVADTAEGFTGTELGRLLRQADLADLEPAITKWRRLDAALSARQQKDGCANKVVYFLEVAMTPARYEAEPETFEHRRRRVNEVLAFEALSIGEDGKVRPAPAAKTLSEAQGRAHSLRAELRRRKVHPDILRFCTEEFLQEDYFHAVLEAVKSLADKIRTKANLQGDGHTLVDKALGLQGGQIPPLAFNSLRTESERSEQAGYVGLLKGLFSAVRNPTAHEAAPVKPVRQLGLGNY